MKRLVPMAMGALLGAPAWAQGFLPPEPQVLEAIAHYAEVRAAESYVDQAQAEARALAAGPHETELSLMPSQRRIDEGPSYTEWEVQLTRGIRLPGKAALDRETGRHVAAAAELRLGDAEHQAARTLLSRWMDWLRAESAAAQAVSRSDSLAQEQAAIERRLALGDASHREREQIEAALARARAEAQQAQALVQARRLAWAASFPQLTLPAQAPPLPEPAPLPEAPQIWIDRIVSRSHEIGAVVETAAQLDSMARRARADRWADPSVGLRMLDERDSAERVYGLVLNVPFGGSRRRAEAEAQSARAAAAQDELAAMRRDIEREAQLSVAYAQSSIDLWRSLEQARLASAASLERSRRAYALGEIGLAELLLAERQDRDAALAEALARLDAHEAQLKVRIDSHELWHPG